jgi:hypothetical protein
MGFRVLLIAVKGNEPDAIQREYGVVPTGEREEIPESPVTGAMLPSGSYLLYINDQIDPDNRVFARLSKNASLIACYAHETVMNSYASAWVNGVEKWSVLHDAQEGTTHLETTGNPPDQLKSIQERLFAAQEASDGVDYVFDIPIDLFTSLGGIRYDHDIGGEGRDRWQVLRRENDCIRSSPWTLSTWTGLLRRFRKLLGEK